MVEIKFYDSWEEAMEAESKAREAADAKVRSWQQRVRAGDILVSQPYPDLVVFHEVLDIERIVGDNLKKYGEDYEPEGIWTLDIYKEPHMKNYRFCRNYSEVVPQGELGDIHLSIVLGKIDTEVFKYLKEREFELEDFQVFG